MEPKEWMQKKQSVLKHNELNELYQDSLRIERTMLQSLTRIEVFDYLVSKMNYSQRKNVDSCERLGVHIHVGDVCYIDYGLAYQYEIGYLHFGLILSLRHGKAFVVPISGNYQAFQQAYSKQNPNGKRHLMRLGKVPGLNKLSVLYVNDAKWINTARIIDVKAHIQVQGELFQEIKKRTIEMI